MAENSNPIEDRYWKEIWTTQDERGEIKKALTRENRKMKLGIIVLCAILLLFFSVPLVWLADINRIVTPAEFLTFEAYRLDSDIQDAFSPLEYYVMVQFIYKWLGYGGAACLLYWMFFINPYEKLRGEDTRYYVQEIVFENPKSPGTFLKHSMDKQRYRWLGFLYMWCVGYLICTLVDASQWTWIMQHQFYWLNKIPTIVPLALIMLIFVNVIFAILFGFSRPETKSGSRKKTAALIVICACLFATIVLALLNANVVEDYVVNWNDYSIKYPENPLDSGPEYYINYNALFWTLGMIFSSLVALLFPICCILYQNKKFREVIDERYKDVLEHHENPWEYPKLKKRHEEEVKLKQFVRRFSAFELTFFFGLVLVALWGFYFYWGTQAGNQVMEYIGIGILAFELIWALFLSPILHYRMEKPLKYQGKSVAWVLSEDRGVGSWKKYWRLFNFKKKYKDSEEEQKKFRALRRFIYVVMGIMALWIAGLGMYSVGDIGGILEAILGVFDIGEVFVESPAYQTSITGLYAVGYMIIAPILLIYCAKILKFNDIKDPDRGKKRIYSLIFLGFLAFMNFQIIDIFNRFGPDILYVFQNFNQNIMFVLIFSLVVGVLFEFLLITLCFPIFIRLDDLFNSIPDIISLFVFGVFFLTFWNYMCEWFLTDPRLHWSWLSGPNQEPQFLRDNFIFLEFFTGVSGYFYWGWVQELLFLGYFCWLLYKIQPNKWLNATISSLLFMMFHWDNIALMLATAAGGFAWALWWDKRRNLFVLGWTHGFNGQLVNMLIPMSMTVGPGAH